MSSPTTTGCLVANNQGLCIESKCPALNSIQMPNKEKNFLFLSVPSGRLERGEISDNAAGIATAILCQASKLEPNSNAPIVALETGKK